MLLYRIPRIGDMKAYDVRSLVNINHIKTDMNRLKKDVTISATFKKDRGFVINPSRVVFRPLYERLIGVLCNFTLSSVEQVIDEGDELDVQYRVEGESGRDEWKDIQSDVYGILCVEKDNMYNFRSHLDTCARELCPGYMFVFSGGGLQVSEPPSNSLVVKLCKKKE